MLWSLIYFYNLQYFYVFRHEMFQKMLGFTLKLFVLVVTFVFLAIEVSTDDNIEVNVEFDTKEKQAIIGNDQTVLNAGIEENNVSDERVQNVLHRVENSILEDSMVETEDGANTNDFAKKNKKKAKTYNKNSLKDAHIAINKFKEIPTPSMIFKDESDKKLEPGFDLTPEEKKTFKIWEGGVIPYYIDVVAFSGKVMVACDKIFGN